MTEERIRSQTNVILEAYKVAVGMDPVPNISDFLKVRAAAISELEKTPGGKQYVQSLVEIPAISQKNVQPTTCKQEAQGKPDASALKEEPMPAPSSEILQVAQSVQDSTSQSQLDFTSLDTETREIKKEEPKQKSAFELLRGIKDPWND